MRRQVAAVLVGTVVVVLGAGARLFVWPPTEDPEHVDAIVVLGGGERARLETGLDWFADGSGDVLVLSAGTIRAAAERGAHCDDDAVVCVEPTPGTTAGEASTVSALAAERGWSSMAVVTSTYHLSRARVLFDQCFEGRLVMVEAPVPRTTRAFGRNVLAEIPDLAAGLTFARAC